MQALSKDECRIPGDAALYVKSQKVTGPENLRL